MLTPVQRVRLYRLRWSTFVLVVLAYILSFFHRVAPGAIAGELQQAFQASGAALGSLAASYFYVYTLMQIPTGVLVDTLGVRRIVALGGVIAGAGSILFGLAETLLAASAGRLLVGLGVSAMFLAMLKINALWFRERHFGTLTGLTVLLGNLGAVLAAAPLVWVLGFTTWRTVFVSIGIFSMLLAAVTWWLVRNHPGEVGLPTMRELDKQPPHAPHTDRWWRGLSEVLRNRHTWPGFMPAFGVAGTMLQLRRPVGGAVPAGCLRPVARRGGAAYELSSRWIRHRFVFAGALSDRLKRRRPVMLAGIALYLLCWLPLLWSWLPPSPWGLVLFFLMGLGSSGFTLVWAVAKEVNRPALSGMATSVVNTGAFFGAALLQPLVGWVMDLGWDGRLADGVRLYSADNYRAGIMLLFPRGRGGFSRCAQGARNPLSPCWPLLRSIRKNTRIDRGEGERR